MIAQQEGSKLNAISGQVANWYVPEIKRLIKLRDAEVVTEGGDKSVTGCPFVDGVRKTKTKEASDAGRTPLTYLLDYYTTSQMK